MCGRFNVIDSPGLQQLLQDLGIDLQLPTRANIAPTEAVGLVRALPAGNQLDAARWWLTPSWAPAVDQKYSMFNARSETLASSRAFKAPFQRQRGIVPMSSFIEWRSEGGVKQPWLVSNAQGAFAAAALWDIWNGDGSELLSCTLVTTAAAPPFEPWHKRMPVVLDAQEQARWLDNSQLIAAKDPLFRSELKQQWRLSPLSREVGNARNKSEDLLRAVAEAVVLDPD
ncbi:SOS response-associated peptidase [Seongchinamella sediminis]|uniref:Abasic site processing protein n=1 Tax=Seongchinamella sediminis TaxID=2283635 RepID=A0A3L7E0N5_9GAMM|nr:SOS response-associated peptidase [Seongchinamella sediminis]RLQ21953.1 SOS response-associated peptidase [Seongchinamella sediminis]